MPTERCKKLMNLEVEIVAKDCATKYLGKIHLILASKHIFFLM